MRHTVHWKTSVLKQSQFVNQNNVHNSASQIYVQTLVKQLNPEHV